VGGILAYVRTYVSDYFSVQRKLLHTVHETIYKVTELKFQIVFKGSWKADCIDARITLKWIQKKQIVIE
jgi:hypothetical protein